MLPFSHRAGVDIAAEFDHSEGMNRYWLTMSMIALLTGCGGYGEPTRQVETATPPPGPAFVSTTAGAPPRPIFDYNVAPAQYSLKPLEQWTEQEAAADALGRIGPPAIPQLVESLRSSDPEARLIAAQVLARMGSDAKEAVPDLVRLLDDPDERIRKAATRALGRIGPDAAAAVPGLIETLLESKPHGRDVRPAAVP